MLYLLKLIIKSKPVMGKGDKKTAKGKRILGSYGVSRPKKKDKPVVVAEKSVKPKAEAKVAKKAVAEKKEVAPKKVAEKKETVAKKETAAKKPAAEKKPAAKKPAAKKEESKD